MQVTETLSDGLKRAFTVVVPAAEIDGKCSAKLADLSRTIKLPGFRPGKVPVNLIRQRYGSQVLAEVMQSSLDAATDAVIEDRGLRPAGQPRVDLTGTPPDFASGRASDLTFSVELEILPEIATPDLAAIALTRLRAEPAPEAVDTMMKGFANRQRDLVEVEDRGAETGDVLTVDFTGSLDGVPFEGGTGGDVGVELGATGFIPGFAEQLEGLRAGEQRRIEVTFPADYHATELAGRAAVFEVIAKALKRPVDKPVDDAFAVSLGFDSLAALREAVHGQIQREYDQASRLRIKRELLDVLSEKADFPAPQNLVDIEFNAIWQRVEADLTAGRVDEEDQGKDEATLRAEYRAIADRRVRLGLLLSEIGRAANIQVSQSELTQALRQEAARYPGQEMQVIEFFRKTPQAIEQLRGPLFEDKVVDYILELAQVEDRLVSPETLAEPVAEDARPAAAVAFTPAEDTAGEPQADAGEAAPDAHGEHTPEAAA